MKEQTFTVDVSDPSDLKRMITKLQKTRKELLRRLGYDQIHFNGSKYNMEHIFPVFQQMFDQDLSEFYQGLDEAQNYYVYFHCTPLEKLKIKTNLKHLFIASKFPNVEYVPFYVGKGKGNRIDDLFRNDSYGKIRKSISEKNKEIIKIKVSENLSEAKALETESKLIDLLGLKVLNKEGLLVNLDEGCKDRRQAYTSQLAKKILQRNGYSL